MVKGAKLDVRAFPVFVVLGSLLLPAYAGDMQPADLVARHLDSLGTAEARASVKSRVLQGKIAFKIMVGRGSGANGQGTWGMVSEQQKSNLVMRFGSGDYHGEQFVFDGNKTYIAATTASQQFSRLGALVHSEDYILKEGLLGGELSTAWALENLDKNQPKLTYAGLKKVDGRQVYDLEYRSKRSSDLQIHLYFDPETYRHVKTVYFMDVAPNMGAKITSSVRQQEIRYTIAERFADFKTENGLTLPSTYSLEFTQELQNGMTNVYSWEMTIEKSSENISLDPKNFDTR